MFPLFCCSVPFIQKVLSLPRTFVTSELLVIRVSKIPPSQRQRRHVSPLCRDVPAVFDIHNGLLRSEGEGERERERPSGGWSSHSDSPLPEKIQCAFPKSFVMTQSLANVNIYRGKPEPDSVSLTIQLYPASPGSRWQTEVSLTCGPFCPGRGRLPAKKIS